MLTIPKLRGGCLGKQIITRKALSRHLNIELSSRIPGDCVSGNNRVLYKIKSSVDMSKCPKSISIKQGSSKDNVIPNPAYEVYSCENSSRFQSRPKSRAKRFFSKSEGNSLTTYPMDKMPIVDSPIYKKSKLSLKVV